jgi:hypothetical protein
MKRPTRSDPGPSRDPSPTTLASQHHRPAAPSAPPGSEQQPRPRLQQRDTEECEKPVRAGRTAVRRGPRTRPGETINRGPGHGPPQNAHSVLPRSRAPAPAASERCPLESTASASSHAAEAKPPNACAIADSRPREREPLHRLIEALPNPGRRQRLPPTGPAELPRRKPRRTTTPTEALLGRVLVCGLLLSRRVGERPQAPSEPHRIRRRLDVLGDRALPPPLGQLQLLLGQLNAHPAPPNASGTTDPQTAERQCGLAHRGPGTRPGPSAESATSAVRPSRLAADRS